jgi:tetratricopeptide (TPR) repeat protein
VTQQHARTSFVGRDRELRELLEALDEAASGRGRLILLGGEPGIGKSRLADELATHARSRGHGVLWGRGWEDAGAPSYWPWVQALRTLLRASDTHEVRRQLGSGAADVAQMLPELRVLLPDLPSLTDFESEAARFQLFDSTATFLRNAARAQALLIVLDDLHAADTPSILFLRFLASQLGDVPILLVGTYRDIELTPDHPLTTAIAEMAREPVTRVVLLKGLPAEAVREFIGSAVDVPPHEQLVAAVWRATSGNPLFIGEAIRLLSAEGRLDDVADLASLRVAVPAGVRAVIARRIGHLTDSTAGALALGAVLGPEFSLEILRKIGDFSGEVASNVVDEAVDAGLLLPVVGPLGRYRFSHDLVRETLYDEQSPGRRARLHRRIATTLEDTYGLAVSSHLAELAFHYVQAARPIDQDSGDLDAERVAAKAIEYARRAGDEAARSLAYEEAARLYGMAIAVFELGAADDETRMEVLLSLGDVHARAGSLDRARAAFLEAADIASRTGAGRQLARAALGYGDRHIYTRAGHDSRQIPLMQDALVLLGGSDERLRVRLLGRLACLWRSSPERRNDSATLSGQALQKARELGDPATLGYALAARFGATWWPENPEERRSITQELLRLAEAMGDGERIVDAHVLRFMNCIELGQIAEARAELSTLGHLSEKLRQPAQLWLTAVYRAEVALLEGDFSLAEVLIPEEMAWEHRVASARDDVSSARMHRFLLRRAQGRIAEEEETVRLAAVEFPWYPCHRAALACLLLDLGRVSEARAVFDELARNEFAALYRDNEWLLGMSLASEAAARLGDSSSAATLYEQLLPFAGRHAVGQPEGSVGGVDRYLGLLASCRGDLEGAIDHLAAAIEVNSGMGARPWTAHSQHDLAEVLRRRDAPGDLVRAAELDRAAKGTALELGMVLADQISDELETTALSAAATPVAAATFMREGEYWSIEFGGRAVRVRGSKGMHYLARLLGTPGQEIHALDLVRPEGPGSGLKPGTDDDLRGNSFGGAGPILDAEAKASYRERLGEIRDELAEAEAWNDIERVVRLQADEQALTHELAGAVGIGGRDRPAVSVAERARVSVTRAIRTALARIGEQNRPLGEHLDATIRTGTFCSYVPDPRAPITWRL